MAESVGPIQVSDPVTVSVAESAAGVVGTIDSGRTTLTVTANSYAIATSAYAAFADGNAGTRGFPNAPGFLPFSEPTAATFDIDLISDYGTNPAAAYALQTSASGGDIGASHSAIAFLGTLIRSNIPGATTIFDLNPTATWQSGAVSVDVQFSSPFIAQPVFAPDFIAGPNGSYSLDPNKRHISIPFTIPAGLSFQFVVNNDTSLVIIPEPSAIVLAAFGLLALGALCRRRARG